MRPSVRILLLSIVLLAATRALASPPDRFEFVLHDGLTATDVAHLDVALHQAYEPILTKLGLEHLPTIRVQIWRDEEAYQAMMERSLGSRAPGSRGYAYGGEELRLLYHTMLSAQREAVHEFAHVATLNLNAGFGNNPRWLWEAVAIYLAGEFVDPSDSGLFADGACPSLRELNAPFDNGGSIYAAGFLLIEFIDANRGFQQVIDLVHSNGDLQATLGIDDREFERRWCESVLRDYSD